jgi:hypothetical protein
MPIKKVAHRAKMVKKGSNKMALKWVPSSFEESDLKKAKKDGLLPEAVQVIFPGNERVPTPPKGYRVMFLAFLLCAFLSLPTSFFMGFSLSMACSYISSWRILFFISLVSSLFVSLFLESTHTGFFGSFFSASAQEFL